MADRPERADGSFQTLAYDKIRDAIVYCRLEPGQKLRARLLEEELGVGRTPIRESLVRLGQQGLVYTIPQSGTYVSKISLSSAENARYVREHLETNVTVECCAAIDDEGRAALERILEQQEEAVRERDASAFFRLDNALHEELFRIAGRHEVWEWISATNTNLERYRWLRTQVSELDWETIMSQHHQLVRAVSEGDPEEAQFISSMHLHLMFAEQDAVCAAFPTYFEE